jgi:hypothetical protein
VKKVPNPKREYLSEDITVSGSADFTKNGCSLEVRARELLLTLQRGHRMSGPSGS